MIGSREFSGRGLWLEAPWGGSFLCEGFFSSQMEPRDTSRARPGAGRGMCSSRGGGVPLGQVNPSGPGSPEPPPSGAVCSSLPVWGGGDIQSCGGHSPLSSYPPHWSQEPPDSFLCSQNIPFASGVSEFSKPGPRACPNKSAPLPHPLQPPSPIPVALGQVPHRISSSRSGLRGPS